jgi:hypothetical protein
MKEHQMATLIVPSVWFTVCNFRVSATVIVLSDGPCETIEKWETSPILKVDRCCLLADHDHGVFFFFAVQYLK